MFDSFRLPMVSGCCGQLEQVIITGLTNSDVDVFDAFISLDDDSDGVITAREFKHALVKVRWEVVVSNCFPLFENVGT